MMSRGKFRCPIRSYKYFNQEGRSKSAISHVSKGSGMPTNTTCGNVSSTIITRVDGDYTVAPMECAARTTFFFWRRLVMGDK